MSSINPVSGQPPMPDPSQIVQQYGHGGGAHKAEMHKAQNPQNVLLPNQQQPVVNPQRPLQEIYTNQTEETQPEKHEEDEKDEDAASSKKKEKPLITKPRRPSHRLGRIKI